ncbi:Dabb family protein [Dactylosporangium salmoneum]|uniref:Stress-response A/B barrel domain-containing protein n=1 Tax=Dactylosporangium salmoneum TaxID=53361 RepID=A0ABP5UXH8_9ACTN
MYVQISLLRWKDIATEQSAQEVLARYRELADIDGVVEVTVGKNQSPWSAGYTDVILVRAEDKAAIERYRTDPRRKQLAATVDELEEHGIGVVLGPV